MNRHNMFFDLQGCFRRAQRPHQKPLLQIPQPPPKIHQRVRPSESAPFCATSILPTNTTRLKLRWSSAYWISPAIPSSGSSTGWAMLSARMQPSTWTAWSTRWAIPLDSSWKRLYAKVHRPTRPTVNDCSADRTRRRRISTKTEQWTCSAWSRRTRRKSGYDRFDCYGPSWKRWVRWTFGCSDIIWLASLSAI